MSQNLPTTSPALLTNGPHHVAVLVCDLTRAVHFYEKVLGLTVLKRWTELGGDAERSVWLSLSAQTFLAVERFEDARQDPFTEAAAAATPSPGLFLLALSIRREDREAWRQHLRREGHPVTHETAYTLYCCDPEGNRIGLSHWPSPRLQETDPQP